VAKGIARAEIVRRLSMDLGQIFKQQEHHSGSVSFAGGILPHHNAIVEVDSKFLAHFAGLGQPSRQYREGAGQLRGNGRAGLHGSRSKKGKNEPIDAHSLFV